MIVEELRKELETIVTCLASSGFGVIDPGIVEKLERITISAAELGMKEGTRLVKNLVDTMKAIHEGTSRVESGIVRLTAIDFYVKKLSSEGKTEDL